jgi:hypothetical protein
LFWTELATSVRALLITVPLAPRHFAYRVSILSSMKTSLATLVLPGLTHAQAVAPRRSAMLVTPVIFLTSLSVPCAT